MRDLDINVILKEELLKEEILRQLNEMGGTSGVSKKARDMENIAQLGAFMTLSGGVNEIAMELIPTLGGIFRKAIKEFRLNGSVPNADELIEYATKYYGKDVRKMAKSMVKPLDI